jgi:hypothetical protein
MSLSRLHVSRETRINLTGPASTYLNPSSFFLVGAAKLITTFVNATDGRPMEIELHGE